MEWFNNWRKTISKKIFIPTTIGLSNNGDLKSALLIDCFILDWICLVSEIWKRGYYKKIEFLSIYLANWKLILNVMMQYFFSLSPSEMGISPFILTLIILFSVLFLLAFGLSSKNMDSAGIMNWMMKKPKDWIGNKNL